ncbi:MAG TPA: hypothetical protein EYN91_23655 [Candidatus Melainabacteria bacterium]|jgi:hypothetical protein|nr:hypothetical protein [Candidatus Melainabacteria bacterium]HIN66841.1 hypothetical protein [Candidatus Obscuribacterales bacterium]
MRADDNCKFNQEKQVDFENATTSWESRLLFAARLMFKPTSEAELRADCASAKRDDFVALNAARGFSTRDKAMEDAYA